MGAVFGLFAGFYYWIGKISGLQYPETLGQIHFWLCAPFRVLFSMFTRCKRALKTNFALKQLQELYFKEEGEKHEGKRTEIATVYQKGLASYDSMDRLTNLNYYRELSQKGIYHQWLRYISMGQPLPTAERVVVFTQTIHINQMVARRTPSLLKNCVYLENGSKILRNMIGIVRNSGYPKALKGNGYRTSILPFQVGRDVGNRSYSKLSPSAALGDLEAIREVSAINREQKFTSLIGIIANPTVLTLAYELIKSKQGNMTFSKGIDDTTLVSLEWINKTSKQLQAGQFKFKPSFPLFSPDTKAGKPSDSRPLGIINTREKVVQKAIQMVLEAVYEPTFDDASHGFRPGRGCHTALKSATYKLKSTKWVIEGDISLREDTIPHKGLIDILKKKILCEKTITLIKSALQAGYIDMAPKCASNQLEAQGSVLSPILCNIFMNELDLFVLKESFPFNCAPHCAHAIQATNVSFKLVARRLAKARKALDTRQIKKKKDFQSLRSGDPLDPKYKRCTYIRYADDFIIGLICIKEEAQSILEKVRAFLRDVLGLDLSLDKTKLTHFPSGSVQFLGADLKGCGHLKGSHISKYHLENDGTLNFLKNENRAKRSEDATIKRSEDAGKKSKSEKKTIYIEAPITKILNRLTTAGFYKKKNGFFSPTRVGRIYNHDMPDILRYYNSIIRGLFNYYTFADNRSSLGMVIHGLKHSCALTLRGKLKAKTKATIFKKFGSKLTYSETVSDKKGNKSEKKYRLFIPDTLALKRLPFAQRFTGSRYSQSIQGVANSQDQNYACTICGSSPAEMHHINRTPKKRSVNKNKWSQ
jgi:retron-type reverse transcriptase